MSHAVFLSILAIIYWFTTVLANAHILPTSVARQNSRLISTIIATICSQLTALSSTSHSDCRLPSNFVKMDTHRPCGSREAYSHFTTCHLCRFARCTLTHTVESTTLSCEYDHSWCTVGMQSIVRMATLLLCANSVIDVPILPSVINAWNSQLVRNSNCLGSATVQLLLIILWPITTGLLTI